jgi:hypothetical protein
MDLTFLTHWNALKTLPAILIWLMLRGSKYFGVKVIMPLMQARLPQMRLPQHPAARLVQSPFAVHAIFAANGPDAENDVLDPMQPQYILVTRPHYDVAMHLLTPEQFEFFHALMNAESLGDALDRAASIEPNFDLPTVLALMLQSGAFQSIQQGNIKTS